MQTRAHDPTQGQAGTRAQTRSADETRDPELCTRTSDADTRPLTGDPRPRPPADPRVWAAQGIAGHVPLSPAPALASAQLPTPIPVLHSRAHAAPPPDAVGSRTDMAALITRPRPPGRLLTPLAGPREPRSPPPPLPGSPSPPIPPKITSSLGSSLVEPPPLPNSSSPSLPKSHRQSQNLILFTFPSTGPPLTSAGRAGSPGHRARGPQPVTPNPALQARVHPQAQPRSALRILCPPLMALGAGMRGDGRLAGRLVGGLPAWSGGLSAGPPPLGFSKLPRTFPSPDLMPTSRPGTHRYRPQAPDSRGHSRGPGPVSRLL